MEELYKKTECALKGEPDRYFETTSGVRQGGPVSPNLLSFYLDYIMSLYSHREKEMDLGVSLNFT